MELIHGIHHFFGQDILDQFRKFFEFIHQGWRKKIMLFTFLHDRVKRLRHFFQVLQFFSGFFKHIFHFLLLLPLEVCCLECFQIQCFNMVPELLEFIHVICQIFYKLGLIFLGRFVKVSQRGNPSYECGGDCFIGSGNDIVIR